MSLSITLSDTAEAVLVRMANATNTHHRRQTDPLSFGEISCTRDKAPLFQIGFIKTVGMDGMLTFAIGHMQFVADGLLTHFAKFHYVVHAHLRASGGNAPKAKVLHVLIGKRDIV